MIFRRHRKKPESQPPEHERRFVWATPRIWREVVDEPYTLECRLNVFNHVFIVDDASDESFEMDALRYSFGEGEVFLVLDQSYSMLLARKHNDTLKLRQDGDDLLISAELVDLNFVDSMIYDSTYHRLNQMSFSFTVLQDRWTEQENGRQLRIVEEAHLHDISVETKMHAIPKSPDDGDTEADDLFHSYESRGP